MNHSDNKNMRSQALALVFFILLSIAVTKSSSGWSMRSLISDTNNQTSAISLGTKSESQNRLSYQKASLSNINEISVPKGLARNWGVLDPIIRSEAVLAYSLSDNMAMFSYNTYKNWPAASLTKIMTAIIVLENSGKSKNVEITKEATETEGVAGGLKEGDIYAVEDLLKIMLLTSSNDAAAAFEIFFGKEEFVRKMNKKAEELGMTQTIFHDASGLSDLNETSANDMLVLMKYVLEKNPEIMSWTRLQNIILQPINGSKNQTVYNINSLANESFFSGGKTGTSVEAGENLVAVFSLYEKKIVIVILGSKNRGEEVKRLTSWIKEAYSL